ncbi:MAG: PD-(D/E)XK nuclease family protein [Candidatus Paceibacterota bacterium]|jgi:hypothetical protein
MPSYSYSAVDLYESCPWAYRKVRIERIKRTPSEAGETGRTVHGRIANYLERLIRTHNRTDWQWAEQNPLTDGDCATIWQRFYRNFTLPDMQAPGVETKLGFDRHWRPVDFFDPEVRFRCVLDLHYRQDLLAIVNDWKTNWTMPETVEKNLQLRIYGWALKRAVYLDVEEILLRLHFLRFGANRQVLLTPDDLADVPAELDKTIARIEADTKFEPTPGSFCGWCGVTAHCPEAARALVPMEIMHPVNHADAVESAKLLLVMQAMARAIKEHLKTYVGVNGPIVVGDQVYGPYSTNSYDLDPEQVTGYLLDKGLEREAVWNILSLSKDSLEKGLMKAGFKGSRKRERDGLMRDILAMTPIIEEKNIGFRKIKAENQPVEQAEAA